VSEKSTRLPVLMLHVLLNPDEDFFGLIKGISLRSYDKYQSSEYPIQMIA